MSKRILWVDGDQALRASVACRMVEEGYELHTAENGEDGLARATCGRFDLVLLDVALPDMSGLDLCRDLRRRSVDTPILVVTARAGVTDKVVALKLGADDYLTKPFAVDELMARIESCLRRVEQGRLRAEHEAYRFGPVQVTFREAEVLRDGAPVGLSAKEYQLLRYFIEHRGAALSRNELLNAVWGYDAMPATRTVDVHIAALRRKLEINPHQPQFFRTIHRMGYKFIG